MMNKKKQEGDIKLGKQTKASDIRTWSEEEKQKRLMDLRSELLSLRSIHTGGGVQDNPAKVKQIKRAIAKILTVMNEK